MEDKRSYDRLDFPKPLYSYMKIIEVEGKEVESNQALIYTRDISGGGMRFMSHLNFPVHSKVITLHFELPFLDQLSRLQGQIVWKKRFNDHLYEYGVKFTKTDVSFLHKLVYLLNRK
jgi:c-di-GMP-binding flagellar brake protein YcgR